MFADTTFLEIRGRHDFGIGLQTTTYTNMSATVLKMGDKPPVIAMAESRDNSQPQKAPKYYRGFVAGVFSGIAKLSGSLPAFFSTHCLLGS